MIRGIWAEIRLGLKLAVRLSFRKKCGDRDVFTCILAGRG